MHLPPISLITSSTAWIPMSELRRWSLPELSDRALRSRGLLTPTIHAAFGECQLKVLGNGLVANGALGVIHRRDVEIRAGERICLRASALMPPAVIEAYPWMARLGEDPLGEALRDRASASRSVFEFLQVNTDHSVHFDETGATWARRYQFVLPEGAVMVMEVFSPSFLEDLGAAVGSPAISLNSE